MNDAVHYLITFVLQVACFLFLARFLLQACRADFYNPISQGIVKVTDPVLKPLRLALPGYRNFDFAALLAAILTQIILMMSLAALHGGHAGGIGLVIVVGILQVAMLCIRIFWWSILIVIIAGWVAPGNYHPALLLLHQITEPLLAPARRLLPSMGGLDFSPILVILLLGLLERLLPQIILGLF